MDNERILMTAFKDLADKKARVTKQIEELEAKKDEYILSNEEFVSDEEGVKADIITLEGVIEMSSLRNTAFLAESIKEDYEAKKRHIDEILKMDDEDFSFKKFIIEMAGALPFSYPESEFIKFEIIAKQSKQKYVYGINAFEEYNNHINDALMGSSQHLPEDERIRQIKDALRKAQSFCEKNIKYLDNAANILLKNKDRVSNKSTIKTETSIDRRREEIRTHLKEINGKIDKNQETLATIDSIYGLKEGLKENNDVQKFIEMVEKMKSLGIISTREAKKLTYFKPEKAEVVVEEVKPEVKPMETQPQELDADYFRRPNTECIICFLGDEKDSFVKDIIGFDNSNRKPILRTATDLFEKIYSQSGFEFDATGVPNLGPGKEAKLLTYPPYKFDYKRQGTNRDKYRLHAIRRHSDLLEKLGYGKGNIIFFGAVAPTDDKNNTKLFDVVGNRCIQALPENGTPAILKPSLDYIEHITRGYVPKALLSLSDNVKLKSGRFIKGDDTIENYGYVAYDKLDATTQANVKKWLEDYFIEQTNTLFSIKDMYEKKKGTTLD